MGGARGRYTITFISPELPKFAANNRAAGSPEENKAVVVGSLAHFGTYTVDEVDKSFTFHIEYSTYPNWSSTAQRRAFSIAGNELTYTDPNASAGGRATVIWRRADCRINESPTCGGRPRHPPEHQQKGDLDLHRRSWCARLSSRAADAGAAVPMSVAQQSTGRAVDSIKARCRHEGHMLTRAAHHLDPLLRAASGVRHTGGDGRGGCRVPVIVPRPQPTADQTRIGSDSPYPGIACRSPAQ